jgi:hypothetical protein
MVIFEHSADIQIFNHQDGLGFRQPSGDLMQRGVALLLDLPMQCAEAFARLRTYLSTPASRAWPYWTRSNCSLLAARPTQPSTEQMHSDEQGGTV